MWQAAAALERGQDTHRLRVCHCHAPTLSRLGHEVEADLGAGQPDVLAEQRREPYVSVVARVTVPADSEQADVEQADREGDGPLALRLLQGEELPDGCPNLRKPRREVEHVVELLLVTSSAPQGVVEILAASLGIESGCLNGGGGIGGDPTLSPARRDRKGADPLERCLIGDWHPG